MNRSHSLSVVLLLLMFSSLGAFAQSTKKVTVTLVRWPYT
jgi:hypothetical protein